MPDRVAQAFLPVSLVRTDRNVCATFFTTRLQTMKKAIILLLLAAFIYVFVQSGTLEVRMVTTPRIQGGVQIAEDHHREYTLHWDRFFRYLKSLPGRVGIQ